MDVPAITQGAEGLLGLDAAPGADDVVVRGEFLKEGYGIVNQDVVDAIRLLFRTEGIVLDPVYTSKAFAGLVDLVRRDYFAATSNVVFVHTGGTPALFPNRDRIVELNGCADARCPADASGCAVRRRARVHGRAAPRP